MARELADYVSAPEKSQSPWIFLLCALGIVIFRTTSRILFFYPARLLQKVLRLEILIGLEDNTPMRFRHLSSGQLFQYLSSDIDQVRALIGFVGLQGANFIIAFFVLVPKIVQFNSHLLLALTPMLVSFLIFTFIVSSNKKYFKLTQEMQGEVQNLIMETYVGKKTIKNFHGETSFSELFSRMSLKELYYFYRSSLGISISLPLVAFGVGLSLLWGANIIHSQNMGPSSLIVFSGFIFLFMEPLSYLSWVGVVISRSHASWARLTELNLVLTTPLKNELDLSIKNKTLNQYEYKIPFWDKEINFEIPKDRWTVFVSKTGHGKTELLLKISDILKLRNTNMSLVSQDPYIFNDSVLRNIFLGRQESNSEVEEAKKLLKLFGLDYLESDLDLLLKLEVGENGKRLSGGQAKRLCLVRSLMSDANVLVWDDPFSSVDLILEKEIVTELQKQNIMKGKSVILTSHRLSTVRLSDYVYYIDKELGIIEKGFSHDLFNSQSKINEYFQKQMV
jgi:ABC-type multidrug transport system fused ATPase/permease subunit